MGVPLRKFMFCYSDVCTPESITIGWPGHRSVALESRIVLYFQTLTYEAIISINAHISFPAIN